MNPALLVTVENLFSNSDNKNIPLQLIQQIALDEGLELNAYQDEFGNWTIGFGHTPAQPGEVWTVQQAYDNLINDINTASILKEINSQFQNNDTYVGWVFSKFFRRFWEQEKEKIFELNSDAKMNEFTNMLIFS